MKNIIGRLIFFIVQFLVLGAAVVLENLSSKKMGVNRYLLFKKNTYGDTILTPERLKLYTVILIVGFIVCLILFMVKNKRERKSSLLFFAAIYNVVGIILLSFQNLNAFPFFIFGIFIAITFQYIWMIILTFRGR